MKCTSSNFKQVPLSVSSYFARSCKRIMKAIHTILYRKYSFLCLKICCCFHDVYFHLKILKYTSFLHPCTKTMKSISAKCSSSFSVSYRFRVPNMKFLLLSIFQFWFRWTRLQINCQTFDFLIQGKSKHVVTTKSHLRKFVSRKKKKTS